MKLLANTAYQNQWFVNGETSTIGDIQRSPPAMNQGAPKNAGFCTQEGLDERRFVLLPLSFLEYLIAAMTFFK